jgi:hypothetical protein
MIADRRINTMGGRSGEEIIMRILPAIMAASLLAATLSACQTTSVGADWAPNTREASRISYVGDDSVITSREWKRREAGTLERLRFSNGASLFFEELYGGATAWRLKDDRQSIRDLYDSVFGKEGNYKPGEIVLKPYTEFKLFHMGAQSDTQKCFLGEASSNKDRGGWHFVLTMCRSLRDAAAVARLDADAIDIVTRLRPDGGELNKAKAAGLTPPASTKN